MLAGRHAATFKKAPRFMRADIGDARIGGNKALLATPRTFMNESGQAVAPLVTYFDIDLDRLLVIHDDIDLPFAKLRVQADRSSGGNNGVSSVIRSLGTQDFWRLRIGVGRPPGRQDPADFVLHPFSKQERPDVDIAVQHAADLVELFVEEGGEAARQRAGEV